MEFGMNQEDKIIIPRFDGKELVLVKTSEYGYAAYLEGERMNMTEIFQNLMESQAVG